MSDKQFTRGKGCHNRKLSDADRAEIVRLYTTPLPDGTWMGATLIARRFGVRHPIIYRELARFGVPTRSARDAHSGGKRCKPITNTPVGEAPVCKCGCGAPTRWLQRKARWARYADGHYRSASTERASARPLDAHRQPGPVARYKSETWLRAQYVERRRTTDEIAQEMGVSRTTIRRTLQRLGIELRSRSESRLGRHLGAQNHAWKGGVADWEYSPDWKSLARHIRDRDEWTCQGCGDRRKRWGHSLHVHHIDGNKLNNDPGNLISLCAGCHRAAHRKEVMPV